MTIFPEWQPLYAEHRIATFPLHMDKRPATRGYNKIGLRGSAQLAFKFTKAAALGFMCGPRSKVSVGDVDTTDEGVLASFLDLHGATPIIVRTASRKFHGWYRFNGERRCIRPWPGLPIDVLGARGFVVAPPSKTANGRYEFVQGSLDDIDRLPVMRGLEPGLYEREDRKKDIANPLRGMREHDGRNRNLFKTIGPIAREIHAVGGTCDALLDVAMSLNRECEQPMHVDEVQKVVGSVWKMTIERHNRIGGAGRAQRERELESGPDALFLLEFLRLHEGPSSSFWIANGLADRLNWTRKRLASARKCLIERALVRQVRGPWQGNPAVYAWPGPE